MDQENLAEKAVSRMPVGNGLFGADLMFNQNRTSEGLVLRDF
jgi:hypothetical protein